MRISADALYNFGRIKLDLIQRYMSFFVCLLRVQQRYERFLGIIHLCCKVDTSIVAENY